MHSRCFDEVAVAGVFVLLMLNGDDRRRKPFAERNEALAKLLFRSRDGIQYVEHAEGHGDKMFAAACDLGLEGIVSKRLASSLSVGAVENLDQGEESEVTCRNASGRWNVLIAVRNECGESVALSHITKSFAKRLRPPLAVSV